MPAGGNVPQKSPAKPQPLARAHAAALKSEAVPVVHSAYQQTAEPPHSGHDSAEPGGQPAATPPAQSSDPAPILSGNYGPPAAMPLVSAGIGSGSPCGGCGATGCGVTCRNSLCDGDRLWVRTEYLLWWVKGQDVPALVTSSPSTTPADEVGVLGIPTTSVLYGGQSISDGVRSGGRLSFGTWLDQRCCLGITGSLWGLGNDDSDFVAASDGDPALGRPFYNTDPSVDGEDAEIVAYPDLLSGRIAVDTDSELYSGNLLLRGNLCCRTHPCDDRSRRLSLLGGYRFFRMNESLQIEENLVSTASGGLIAQGTTFDVTDIFRTQNEFHGAEFGLWFESQRDIWTLDVLTSVAFGYLSREVFIEGSTVTTVPGEDPIARSGGLLTQSTNIGYYDDAEFTALPQIQANLGCQLTGHLRGVIGYTFLFLGDVFRAGEQIDRQVNGLLLDPNLPQVGPQRPTFPQNSSDLWVMGMNFGLEYVY
jgi:hypothetical protein